MKSLAREEMDAVSGGLPAIPIWVGYVTLTYFVTNIVYEVAQGFKEGFNNTMKTLE